MTTDIVGPPRTPEDVAQSAEFRQMSSSLKDVYGTLNGLKLDPKRVLMGVYRSYGLKGPDDLSPVEEEVGQSEQKPWWVFDCRAEDGSRRAFKAQMKDDEGVRNGTLREVAFYREGRQSVLEALPRDVAEAVRIPEMGRVVDKDGGLVGFELPYIEGELLGPNYHFEAPADIEPDDVEALFSFINEFHDRQASWWGEHAPAYYGTIDRSEQNPGLRDLQGHRDRFAARRELIRELVGDEYVTKMEQLLARSGVEGTFTLDEDEQAVVNSAIHVANVIKGTDGKLHVIDWEPARLSHPVIGSAYLIQNLWQNPELHDQWLAETLKRYDDPKARDFLRYELIFLRYSGVAVRFYKAIADDPQRPDTERQHAKHAMASLGERLKETVDRTGPWAQLKG